MIILTIFNSLAISTYQFISNIIYDKYHYVKYLFIFNIKLLYNSSLINDILWSFIIAINLIIML